MPEKNEVDKFFEDIKTDGPIVDLEQPKEEVKTTEEVDETPKDEPRDNREVRRLKEKLEREKEMGKALNTRVQELASEVDKFKSFTIGGDERLIKVFGDSDEGKAIAKIFSDILDENSKNSKAEAVAELKRQQQAELEKQREEESYIDSQLEALEDKYNTDLTSNSPKAKKDRKTFLELLQSLSPKDDEGNITDYADFNTTFKLYQSQQPKPDSSRNKELSARTMQHTKPTDSGSGYDPIEKYLNEQGIRTRITRR